MKGMSTVVATILMLAITIALSGTAYLYLSGYITGRISTSFSIIDSYQNSVTIMNDGSSTITSFSSVKVDGNDAIYRVSTQDDSMTVHYKFGEGSGTTADDSSGKGNTGTIYGATPVDGYFGKSLSFDGVDDYVDIGDSSLYFSDAVTEDAWSDTDDVLKYGKVLSFDSYPTIVNSLFNDDIYKISFQDEGGSIDDPNLTVAVSASADDASNGDEYSTNELTGITITIYAYTTTSSSGYSRGGFRFTNISIPQGATIDVAYLSLNVVIFDDPNFRIYAENVDNATSFATGGAIRNRPPTTNYTDWIANSIGLGLKNSPSITGIVQEVINRVGWASGNALNILAIPYTNNSNRVAATSFDGNSTNAAKLYIQYTVAGSDTTPPVRSNGQPTGTLPSGTTSTTISLTTDEAATCRYSTSAGTAYSSMTNTFSTTGGTSHSTLVTGLTDGNTYYYYVRCQDSAGNANTNDFPISFSVALPFNFTLSTSPSSGAVIQGGSTTTTVTATLTSGSTQSVSFSASGLPSGASANFTPTSCNPTCSSNMTITTQLTTPTGTYPITITGTGGSLVITTSYSLTVSSTDITPPTASIIINSGASTTTSTSVTLTLSCSDASGVRDVRYSNDGTFDTELFESFNSTRAWNLTSGDGTKTAWYQCRDNSTNQNTVIVNDTIILDTTAPVRSNGQPNGTLAAGTTQTNINLTTNEAATCRYSTTASIAYISMTNTFNITGSTSHSQLIPGLSNGNTYNYYVKCNDTVGNVNTNDFNISFSVALPGDTTPPALSNPQPTGTLPAGTTSTNINLTATDSTLPVSCRYSTAPGTAYSSMTNTLSNIGGNTYSDTVIGLTNGNNYNYYVRCIDGAGNNNTNDFPISFSVASSGGFQPSNHTATTVEAWVNPAGTGTRYILANPYLNTQNSKYAIYVSSDNQLGVAQTSDLGSWSEVRGGVGSVPNGVWTYVAYTWDAANGLASYYINGALVGSRADAGTVLGVGGDIRMGSHAYISNGYFNGIIDEVRIYNRSLSEGEIKANFDIGSQINSGQLATIEIYNNLSAGKHTLRICTQSMCQTQYLTIV